MPLASEHAWCDRFSSKTQECPNPGAIDLHSAYASDKNGGASKAAATILVVDDEPEVREIIAEFLSESGYRVVQAADGTEALRVLEATPELDLLVSDVRMPGISGIELAERATSDRSDLKVILISGFFVHENIGRRLLRKPFRLQELDEAVRDELGR